MRQWSNKLIKELGRVVTGKTPPKNEPHYFDGDELFVSPKDLNWDHLYVTQTSTRVSNKALNKLRNQVIPKNTVMFTSLSFGFGKMGIASRPSLTNQQINSVVVNEQNDFHYVYYLLKACTPYIFAYNSGIDTPIVPKSVFERIQLKCPELGIQRKIAAVLWAYDELIENNKRRIVLLENLAQEIYREWFARFRFPGNEKVKKLKALPEQWSIKTIGDLCTRVTDGAHMSPTFVNAGKPMASVKDMHRHGFSLNTVKTISDKDFEDLKKADCLPLKNDVLIAKDGSYLKHVFVWDHDYEIVILSSIAILRPNLERIRPYFLAQVLKQDSTKAMMAGYVSGSALPRIVLEDFKKMRILVPPLDLIEIYENEVTPIYRCIYLLNKQNDQLRQQRNRLLPRLISGSLSVENLDIQFPPSMTEELNRHSKETSHA